MNFHLFAFFLALLAPLLTADDYRGDWSVRFLDETHIALVGDYTQFLLERYLAETPEGKGVSPAPDWRVNRASTVLIAKYRIPLNAALQDYAKMQVTGPSGAPVALARCGYWVNAIGQSSFPTFRDGAPILTRNADLAHYLFLEFQAPLRPGAYAVTLPDGEHVTFDYRPDSTPSSLFNYNQVGYLPAAARKYAYLGAWMGSLGSLDLSPYDGKPFALKRTDAAEPILRGVCRKMAPDPQGINGEPLFGEVTLCLDFSACTTPGEYYLEVQGIGRSPAFRIEDAALADAFYIHARGLYHKRCGIAKSAPYTAWSQAACHTRLQRNTFPPEDGDYSIPKAGATRDSGFFDEAGNPVAVNHFELIRRNPPPDTSFLEISGGWHDAADFDRRPYHLRIVGELAAAYLFAPDHFTDGQLDIPESGNGLPDILDEAAWGIRHLMAAQLPSGAVPTWFESDHHPNADEYDPARDDTIFQISLATRNSTLQYCAYAALLANALAASGPVGTAAAQPILDSARRAWAFARNPANRITGQAYRYPIDGKEHTLTYREAPDLPPDLLVKAALNLYLADNDSQYLDVIRTQIPALQTTIRTNFWSWSPFHLVELETCGLNLPDILRPVQQDLQKRILKAAREMLEIIDAEPPYHANWYPSSDWRLKTMGFGNALPLRRAETLLAASFYADNLKEQNDFREAALLANDFQNGANPLGMTLTSGLGTLYPARFLDLPSYADGIDEFVPGITPYFYTYRVSAEDASMAHGIYSKGDLRNGFAPVSCSLLPAALLVKPAAETTANETRTALSAAWPVWRRWSCLQAYNVAGCEYTVWETIAPAVVSTGLLLPGPVAPSPAIRHLAPRPAPPLPLP